MNVFKLIEENRLTLHGDIEHFAELVGLTVDELIDLEQQHRSHESLTKAIEAKLKEKNT